MISRFFRIITYLYYLIISMFCFKKITYISIIFAYSVAQISQLRRRYLKISSCGANERERSQYNTSWGLFWS